MNHHQIILQSRILDALQPAVGQKLSQVRYWCVENEATEERILEKDFYSGGEIELVFDNHQVVWVTWDENAGWEQPFSICALADSSFNRGALVRFDANGVDLWKPCLGTVLTGFDVVGWNGAPDAIRLFFGEESVLLATGYEGVIGDGEDIFARPNAAPHVDGEESILWSSVSAEV